MSIPTTTSTPATPGTPDDSLATSAPHSPATQAPALPEPVYLEGPAPFAVVLGLLGLLFASTTLFTQLTDVAVPWTQLGPWTVVAAGLLVVVIGAIGLRSSRTRG